MNSSISSFNQFRRPQSEPLAGAYSQVVSVYENHVTGTHNTYKLMAQMQAELDKLVTKARSHSSDSLKEIIKRKEAALETLKQFSDNVRKAYFSRGEVAQATVNANMELFAA